MMDGDPVSRFALMLWLLAAVLPTPACAIGESAARIKGEVVDERGAAHDGCRLELLDKVQERVLDYRKVEGNFGVTFVLPPTPDSYRLRLSCKTSTDVYLSEPMVLGDLKKTYDVPVDLGSIVLKRH
jgi:hypothetical protein